MRMLLAVSISVLLLISLVVWRLQPNERPSGKVELIWVSDANPLRERQAALFNVQHPGIHVIVDPSNSGVDKVIVQSLGGVGPDIFDSFDSFDLAAYVQSGVALDLTDRLATMGIDVHRDAFPGLRAVSEFNGRIYGVPTNGAADALWYHADIFEREGITPPTGPWKWDDLIPIAERLTSRDPHGRVVRYGLLFDWWNWRHFFAGFGAHVFNPDGTQCIADSSQAVAAVQLMHDLVYRYRVSPTPVEENSMATQGGFGSGTVTFFGSKRGAMAIGGRWWLAQLRGFKGLHLAVAESPYETVRRFHAYGRATLVNKQTKHLEAALEFQRFLAGHDYQTLVNAQADGIAAFPKYDQGFEFLHDPDHPNESFNAIWRDAMAAAVPEDASPFVDGNTVTRLMQVQLDLVQADGKSPAAAMRDAAKAINDEIAAALKDDPGLAERYRTAIAREKN